MSDCHCAISGPAVVRLCELLIYNNKAVNPQGLSSRAEGSHLKRESLIKKGKSEFNLIRCPCVNAIVWEPAALEVQALSRVAVERAGAGRLHGQGLSFPVAVKVVGNLASG